ncbi:phospholipase C type enzyme [Puccinia graminis f. sp. tritici]|uniref:Phospholipase C type enzyme n=1 Tax=Puccinia graminis f. sp. tritici TaxID=56615 RepID=A0A5B0LPR0_PUCGR|nr:phospholipase C type enzyme [Puccinia graminis f. sp. tritici]KAA1128300.1 phospholipase C type enzyme [Puccinia graminis f. sp. tritici]
MSNLGESSQPVHVKFLTLNCWGLKFVSAHRQERIHAIADFLACSSSLHSRSCSTNSLEPFSDLAHSSTKIPAGPEIPNKHSSASPQPTNETTSFGSSSKSFDIVALQELWVYHDFLVIRDRAKEGGFKYSKWFHSAALGSGLAILSRFPIISSHFHPYLLNGHPLHFIQGDFFVGKSVGSCLLDVPTVGEVEVFTTHLYAPHDVPAPEWKRAHRTAQAWELAKLVRASAERGRTVFVCGDLNSVPSSLPITLLQSYGQLRDSWIASHPNGLSTISTNEMTYRTAIQEEGITCDSLINTFTASKNAANRGAKGYGKRLDYILYRPAAKRLTRRDRLGRCQTEFIDDQNITCGHCAVILTDPIPVFGYSYSDHFAVEASFTIYPSQSTKLEYDHSGRPDEQSNNVKTLGPPKLTTEQLNNCISALMVKYRSSERSTQVQLALFLLCVLLIPGVSVAASFQPLKYLNWIFTLLSFAVGGFGITMLYSGFLAGNWERSAIQEVCDQVEFELQSLLKNQHHQHHSLDSHHNHLHPST